MSDSTDKAKRMFSRDELLLPSREWLDLVDRRHENFSVSDWRIFKAWIELNIQSSNLSDVIICAMRLAFYDGAFMEHDRVKNIDFKPEPK